MTTIRILFIGELDHQLVTDLQARGIEAHCEGAERSEIWRKKRLLQKGSGYALTERLKQLLELAHAERFDFIVVRVPVELALKLLPKLPAQSNAKLILDFRHQPDDSAMAALAGYRRLGITSRRKGKSALEMIICAVPRPITSR